MRRLRKDGQAAIAACLFFLCFPYNVVQGEDGVLNITSPNDPDSEKPGMASDSDPTLMRYKEVTLGADGVWRPPNGARLLAKGTFDWRGTLILDSDVWGLTGLLNSKVNIEDKAKLRTTVSRKISVNSETAGQYVLSNALPGNADNSGGQSQADLKNSTIKIPDQLVKMRYGVARFDIPGTPAEIDLKGETEKKGIEVLILRWRANQKDGKTNSEIYSRFTMVPDNNYLVDHGNVQYKVVDTELTKSDPVEDSDSILLIKWQLTHVHALNTGIASEAVKASADNQRALFNMWRLNDSYVFHRGDSLRRAHQAYPGVTWRESDPQVSEGVWANVYKGKYSFDSPYGRKVHQDYQSIFLGFDKENEGDFHNGTLYRGVFFDLGKASAVYPTGKGDLDSKGLGAYLSWQGNHGHFWDAAFRVDQIGNEYVYTDSAGTSDKNTYDTWAWGLSGQYGFTKTYDSGLYIEPVVGLSYGKLNPTSYTLEHSHLRFDQEGSDFLTGRAGFRIGKVTSDALGPYSTNVYARAMVNHDFLESGDATTTFYGDTLKVNTIGEKDTWTDLSVGIQRSFRQGSGYLELSKTVGGDVRSDWQIAAGLSFYWDPEPRYHGGPRHDEDMHVFSWNNAAGKGTDSAPRKGSASFTSATLPAAGAASAGTAAVAPQYAADTNAPAEGTQPEATGNASARTAAAPAPAYNRAGVYAAGDSDVFTLPGVTVEADRPQWEKNLSPGTVSVVYPDQYKGEMKGVPELLQTVSGVFVQKINGTGHYALARVRGATGQQVSIYIDGVRINSEGETGVDLSQIPSENIERIEVYKGYIPARFAGASIGGAINIVTKKPEGAHGSVNYGMRSFGGYTGGAEVTAPLAGGSLMVQVNRDQANGEFPYTGYGFHKDMVPGHASIPFEKKLWRGNNWYRKTDAMVKWQDDHWILKAQYMKKNEGVPDGAKYHGNGFSDDWYFDALNREWHQGSLTSMQNENTDLLLGRRQQWRNLEWGAYVNYGLHKKNTYWHGKWSEYTPVGVVGYYDHSFYGLRLDGSWKANDSNQVEFLFNYSSEVMKTDSNVPNGSGNPLFSGDLPPGRGFLPRYDIKHYYFQIQDNMALDRRKTLIFSPLWRAERMEMTTLNRKIPSSWSELTVGDHNEEGWKYSYDLALKKYIGDSWTIHGSYGTYYRAPNFYEMYGDGGAFVRPKPRTLPGDFVSWENGNQWDLGMDWKGKSFGANTNLSLSYFNRHVRGMSAPFYTGTGVMYYASIGEGNIDGVEFEGNWAWKNWEFAQTVTYNNSHVTKWKGKDQQGTVAIDSPFPFIPEWETNSRLSYFFHDHKMSLFTEYHYTDQLFTSVDEGSSSYYDALKIFNVGFKYNPGSWKFTFGVNDLFNKGPEQKLLWKGYGYNVDFPQQGRTFYFTTQYSF